MTNIIFVDQIQVHMRFVGNGEDRLPQSDVDSMDVLAAEEQLSFNINSK